MLRFIFVCMGVVVLSVAAIGAQYMMDGVSGAADSVMARNAETTQDDVQAIAFEEFSPEALNAIETTAGTPTIDPNDTFTGGFTDEAPKALRDPAAPVATPVAPTAPQDQAN